jgi:anti-sigma-K factor RskA
MITCETCREHLAEHALGQGESAQRAAVEEHLNACPACRTEWDELAEAWSLMPLALPATSPEPALLARIESRLDEDGRRAADEAAPSVPFRQRPRERALSYLLAASVLIALTWGGVHYVRLVRDGIAPGEQAAARSAEELARRLGNLQRMERLLQSDNVRMASLHNPQAPDEQVEAYVVWDIAAGQGHVYAFDLPPAPEGSVYQIWTSQADGSFTPGPLLKVNQDGLGSAIVDLPLTAGLSVKAVVTREPRGGSKSPTGEVVLEATL